MLGRGFTERYFQEIFTKFREAFVKFLKYFFLVILNLVSSENQIFYLKIKVIIYYKDINERHNKNRFRFPPISS